MKLNIRLVDGLLIICKDIKKYNEIIWSADGISNDLKCDYLNIYQERILDNITISIRKDKVICHYYK